MNHSAVATNVETNPQSAEPATKHVVPKCKVAYMMSRFPKLTETFILFEILAVLRLGHDVAIYPLLRARNTASHPEGASLLNKFFELFRKPNKTAVMHPEAARLMPRVHFHPFLSWAIVQAHLHFLLRRPRAYFGALWTLIRANWGSANYLFGALAVFPKTVRFAFEMKQAGIKHVHAHFANHPTAAAFVIHRLTGIPFSFTAHGADLQVDYHMLREKVHEAAHVVTISNYNKKLIVNECGESCRDKVEVIHCGVDTSFFQPTAEPKPSNPPQGLNIVCIGTMYEVKGHTYLIEACRLLKQRGISFKCRLIGDGPDRQKLIDQVEAAGLDKHVLFYGMRTRAEIAEMHKESSVLSVPSVPTSSGRREGIPVVLMEAMASGLAVVASDISGIPELVEDGKSGLLIPPRDAAALADALAQLAGDTDLRRRLGAGGRETVLRRFNLESNAEALARLFHRTDCGTSKQ